MSVQSELEGVQPFDLGSHISILLVQEAVTPSGRPCGLELLLLGRSSLESIFLEVPVQRKLLGVA